MNRFEKKENYIIDNFPDYNDYNAAILTFLKLNYPNEKIEGYNYFPEFEGKNNYIDINYSPIISISDIKKMRKDHELSEEKIIK